MASNANNFIQNRKRIVSITYDRINHIIWYVAECYQILLKDNPVYSKKKISNDTTFHFEDYLKIEFIDSYLTENKKLILSKCSELANISFHYENQKRYIDIADNKEKPDKIDIYINRLGLQETWNEQDENVYFVIECKRIEILSDCKAYVKDIQKFADRRYKKLRLPFEGQLAFIENNKLSHLSVSTEINKILKALTTLKTIHDLKLYKIHSIFNGCYSSIHKRNHGMNDTFTILHLLMDYSTLVAN